MSSNRWPRGRRAILSRARQARRQFAAQNRRSSALRVECLEDRCVPAASSAVAGHAYGGLPLSFEINRGQADSAVRFLSHGDGYGLYLTPTEAVLDLGHGSAALDQPAVDQILSVQLVGGNSTARLIGLDLQPGVSNYLIGDDPSEWITGVAHYGRAEFQGVYPGVNLVYYGNDQRHLEYDFVLAAGADPAAIRLSFQGTQGVALNRQGDLVLHTADGDVVEQSPVVYQTVNGVRQVVPSRYELEPGHQVAFQIGAYDATRPLVIDPTYSLSYSTYLGGSGGAPALAIAVDSAGATYITGDTGNGFPTQNPLQKNLGGNADAFVTKLNPSGTALVYSTYLGGRYNDVGTGIAVDAAGDAYVTGRTASSNFPTKNAFQPTNHGGPIGWDAFVAKLNPAGSALLYSSYLGGSADETSQNGIAVDNAGDAFLTGYTSATDFPTTPGAFQATLAGGADGFVTKLNTTLSGASSLVYSTYLGSLPIFGIAVDGGGNAYMPSGNANLAPGYSVTKLDPTGSLVVYSTPMSPSSLHAIAVDAAGDAYVTGGAGSQGVLVTKLDSTGSQVYSLTFGGTSGSSGHAIAVDSAGHAFVTGTTDSSIFPQVSALQPAPTLVNQEAAFVAELDPSLTGPASIVFSTYLGGSNTITEGEGIAVDGSGNAYVTGLAYGGFPTTAGSFEPIYPYHGQHPVAVGFVAKIGLQITPGAVPASSPTVGADPLTPIATATSSPVALAAGGGPTDFAGAMPPSRWALSLTSTRRFPGTGGWTAPAHESASPSNGEISPVGNADMGSDRWLNMLLAIADGDWIDGGPAGWLAGPTV